MKINFKKISAIGASVLMTVGMSGFAAAANFPAPYSDGSTSATAIVYGANAATTDYSAVTSINSYLKDMVSDDATAPEGESYLFEKTTDNLNLGDNLTDIKSVSLDEDELPTILADATYSNKENTDFNYDQKIDLSTQLQFSHFKDNEYADDMPSLGIRIAKSSPVLNYTLDFTKSAEDDTQTGTLNDFKDTQIEMMGKTYDIVDATNSSNTFLVLMSGVEKGTLSLGESGTYNVDGTAYEIEVTYVDADECKFSINGESTAKLTDGSTDKLKDGTEIGVTEVDYSTGAVTEIMRCEFWIGATKIDLEDTKEVQFNDVDVDKLKVFIDETAGASNFKLNKITLEWKADGDIFLSGDDSIMMPGFETFSLSTTGLVVPDNMDTIEARGSSTNKGTLKANIKSGLATIEILGTNGTGGFNKIGGDGDGEGLLTSNTSSIDAGTKSLPATGDTVTNIVYDLGSNTTGHQYFAATYYDGTKTGTSYLVEVSSSDDTDGVTFKDVLTSEKLADGILNSTAFEIGDAQFTLNSFVAEEYVIFSTSGSNTYIDRIVTEEGLMIYLPINGMADEADANTAFLNMTTNATTYVLRMDEEDKDGTLGSGVDINVTYAFNSDQKVQTKIVTADEAVFLGNDMLEDSSNDNFFSAYAESDLGTYVTYDSDPDVDVVDVVYYGEQVYGDFYISESASASVEGGAMIFTDAEKSSWQNRNLVLVGGSCINSATAAVLGGAYCESDFTDVTGVADGQFLIESFANPDASGKVALVVAGYSAADTSKAALTLIGDEEVDTTVGSKYMGTTAMAEGSVLETA